MLHKSLVACLHTLVVVSFVGSHVSAAELYGLTPGPVELQSAGPMTFGPSSVLFIGDPKAAKVYALNVEDTGKQGGHYEVGELKIKIEKALGAGLTVVDMAVNPETGNAFLGLSGNGKGLLAKVAPDGTISKVSLDKIGHAVATLPNAPEDKIVQRGRRKSNPRSSSITDIAYTDGKVLVAGLESGDAPSSVREFDFPFREKSAGMSVQIFHAAHGRSEDTSPIQTFVPFNIGGEASLLAGYTCTPLVKIPVAKISDKSNITGTTVAELGNRNRPLDMIVYKSGGKDYLLMANSARGVMKISTEDLEENEGLTEPVRGGGVAGQKYETIESLKGVVQLDKVDDGHAVVIMQNDDEMMIKTIHLP